ncbi:MAG: exodeoxyribonuclease VII small subunit, partial [Myxococcaceae bacterium]
MTTRPATSSARASAAVEPASYEAALAELEQLVSQLDAGQLPLEQLLTHYQRGAIAAQLHQGVGRHAARGRAHGHAGLEQRAGLLPVHA